MNNKEHLWRLEDDNGKPVAEKPKQKITAFFNGKPLGEVQSITMESSTISNIGSSITMSPWERETTFRARRVEVPYFEAMTLATPYEPHDSMLDTREIPIRTRTIENAYPDILDQMMREHHRYEAEFHRRPTYYSLNTPAYRSFWLEVRARERLSSGLNEERFMGVEVMCNPLQGRPVAVLGNAEQEGIQRGLYSGN